MIKTLLALAVIMLTAEAKTKPCEYHRAFYIGSTCKESMAQTANTYAFHEKYPPVSGKCFKIAAGNPALYSSSTKTFANP